MRILVCNVSGALGGTEHRMEAETKFLSSRRHEVLVATPRFPGYEAWELAIERAGGRCVDWHPRRFIERGCYAAPFRWLALPTAMRLRRLRIGLAHIAMPSFSDGLSLAYMLNVAQIPFVVGVHSNFGRPVPLRRKWVIRDAFRGLVGGY